MTSDDIAISLSDVSKCFKLYDQPVDRLKDLLLPTKVRSRDFWALRDINANITKGQTVGLVGQNGSGKSTLLQLIVGTLTPTSGQIQAKGRIAALLELGSGFNPEFTGRQNVFFNGRVLGLSQAEIEARFDQIAAFADIGEKLEEPVKTYSSGMFIRLAFAVIINTDPDILIVDEALAVGDIYFQQKCFQRIRELRDQGVTILFVSHESASVFRLCDRAMLLEHGQVVMDGEPKPVLDLYEAQMLKQFENRSDDFQIQVVPASPETTAAATEELSTAPAADNIAVESPDPTPNQSPQIAVNSDDLVQIQFVRILNLAGEEIPTVTSSETIQIAVGVWCNQALADPHVGFKIRNRQGEVIFETNTQCMGQTPGAIGANELLEVRFRCQVPLWDGQYTISVGVANEAIGPAIFRRTLIYAHDLAVLTILKNPKDIIWAGITNLNPTLQILNPTTPQA
ncbi:ABC transporter ATP-binding protein [filamentous cyanobacterium LEGE 11480]|uniref:ABC transporter ATP-binding protein n=2 Tax=Romeriopsis TaxID=2992131 RepID=A0A928VQD1_9CYAN|nr:ABC transporter ATP-binding protein [Romeriopsis navalis LEGE 11480]